MMMDVNESGGSEAADGGRVRLEQTLVEAYYLGHSLRSLAGDPDFSFRQITATVCEPLIAWAKFIEDRLEAGESPFKGAARRQK
ncbi:hypothetical protein [Methylocystis echinoides]|jgi:hypothetical protein|uniref:hypothetical protein n=1 Tax=Methylocystis echinoides TaxID=29468 RepID=UPI00344158C4